MDVSVRRRILLGVLLVAVGLVWIGQGIGLLQGSSFMVDDPRWAVAGVVAVLGGAALLVSVRRRP